MCFFPCFFARFICFCLILNLAFWLIVKLYGQQAGIGFTVTPHMLRHSYATHQLSGGRNLRELQEALGHASLQTTQIYTQLTNEHLREQYDKAHPRA